jgi:hypothetical protein
MLSVTFTAPSSLPDEFSFAILNNAGPMDLLDSYRNVVDQTICTSNGMTVTIAKPQSETVLVDDNGPMETHANTLLVQKNGITADTVITCSFYFAQEESWPAYSEIKFYTHYTASNTETKPLIPATYATITNPAVEFTRNTGVDAQGFSSLTFSTNDKNAQVGDSFALTFSHQITPAGLSADPSVFKFVSINDSEELGRCTSQDSKAFTCTWTTEASSVNIRFQFATVDLASNTVLSITTNLNVAGDEVFAFLDAAVPLPVFNPVVVGKMNPVNVRFVVPSSTDASSHRLSISGAVQLGSKCLNNGVVFATVSGVEMAYQVTFTAAAIASLQGKTYFHCDITVSIPDNGSSVAVRVPFHNEPFTIALTPLRGARLAVGPLNDDFAHNYISIRGFDGGNISDNLALTITGLIFPESASVSKIQCFSSTFTADVRSSFTVYVDTEQNTIWTANRIDDFLGCTLALPAGTTFETIRLYGDGMLLDTLPFAPKPLGVATQTNNFFSGARSTGFFTVPQVPIDLLKESVFVSVGASVVDGVAVDCLVAGTPIACAVDGGAMECHVKDLLFSTSGYVDFRCTIRATPGDATTPIVVTLTGASGLLSTSSFDFGPASVGSPSPFITAAIVNTPQYIGDEADLVVDVYGISFEAGDSVAFYFGLYQGEPTPVDFFGQDGPSSYEAPGFGLNISPSTVTFTADQTFEPTGTSYRVRLSGIPLSLAGVFLQAHASITTAGSNGVNEGKTFNTSRTVIPAFYEKANDFSLDVSSTAPAITLSFETNVPQDLTFTFYAGSSFGAPVIESVAYAEDTSCGVIAQSQGAYTISTSSVGLTAGTTLKCVVVATYTYTYACAADCATAPSFTASSSVYGEINETFTSLTQGVPTVKLMKTYGAFSAEKAGFVMLARYTPTAQPIPLPNSDLGLNVFLGTTDIPVHTVTETAVSDEPIGYLRLGLFGWTYTGFAELSTLGEVIDGLFIAKDYWAVPMFDSHLMPTLTNAPMALKLGEFTSNTVLFTNAASVVDIVATPITGVIREQAVFTLAFRFTTTNLDSVDVDMDFSAAPVLGTVSCDDLRELDYVVTDADTNSGPEAGAMRPAAAVSVTVDQGVASLSVDRFSFDRLHEVPSYELVCTFTAKAFGDTTPATENPSTGSNALAAAFDASGIVVRVLLGDDELKSADVPIPAIKRLPVDLTRVVFSVPRTSVFSAKALTVIVTRVVTLIHEFDATFTLARVRKISQVYLNTNILAIDAQEVAAERVVVTLHVSGVSVTDAQALSSTVGPALSALGYTATVEEIDVASVEIECVDSCGGDCGLCVDGQACVAAADCFSETCIDGKCGTGNSAATVSMMVCATLVVVASVLLF